MNDEEQKIYPNTTPLTDIPEEVTSAPVKKSKRSIKWLIALVVLLVLVGFGGTTWLVYNKPPTDPIVRKIVNLIPYPAVKVNDQTLTIKDYLVEYDALVSFFDSFEGEQFDRPSESDLESSIINTMINKSAIEQLSSRYGVEADEEAVNAMFESLKESEGSADSFEEELKQTFGWEVEEFRDRVIEPIVLANKMSDFVAQNADLQKEKREQIEAAYARLDAGDDFMVVASETNDDRSAIFGGDLGSLPMSDLPEEWQPYVAELEVGEHTPIIENSEGFAILFLTERVAAGEEDQVWLSAILVRKKTMEEVVESFIEESKIKRYIGEV